MNSIQDSKTIMYRTDKQFMTDPETAESRIYIGGLTKRIVKEDLKTKFKIHGKILGMAYLRIFAFIQYESASQAKAAIANENRTWLKGKKYVNLGKPSQTQRLASLQQRYEEKQQTLTDQKKTLKNDRPANERVRKHRN